MTKKWLSYAEAHRWEAEAARLGVSQKARAAKGFMREYQKAGSATAMERRPLPSGVSGGETWGQKREAFVARHLAQYQQNPTYRRYLALIMWAYKPAGAVPGSSSSRAGGRSRSAGSRKSGRRVSRR